MGILQYAREYDTIPPQIIGYSSYLFRQHFTRDGVLLEFSDFKKEVAIISRNNYTLGEDFCRAIFELYYDKYEYIKFLWGYTHPQFQNLNKEIIQRMVELVSHDDVEQLVELQSILPAGMSVIHKDRESEAYEIFVIKTQIHNKNYATE